MSSDNTKHSVKDFSFMEEFYLPPAKTVSFADVAHQTLIFDTKDPACKLALDLIDTPWVQRLRRVAQTGNTKLVYTFAEHTRFGHSVGVAYLALTMLNHLEKYQPEQVQPYRKALICAALLHDIGHISPGSHLAEQVWSTEDSKCNHEDLTKRVLLEDSLTSELLNGDTDNLLNDVIGILENSSNYPAWLYKILAGNGWNIDRGNWCIVDSAMCAVTYGRYNVQALIDGFVLTNSGELVIRENRLDALTHFLVARDSMYRQVYQHRTLQAADALTKNLALRLRDLLAEAKDIEGARKICNRNNIYADETMLLASTLTSPTIELPLNAIFEMTEAWWSYHIEQWCNSKDPILRDLATRVRDRNIFKTIRLPSDPSSTESKKLIGTISDACAAYKYDPRYYMSIVDNSDRHRSTKDEVPMVLLDSGCIRPATSVEPVIAKLFSEISTLRKWAVVPKEVKEKLGITR